MVCKVRSNYGVDSDDDDSYEDEEESVAQGGYASEHSMDYNPNMMGKTLSDPTMGSNSSFAPASFSENEGLDY